MNSVQKPHGVTAAIKWGKKHRIAVIALALAALLLIYFAARPSDPAQGMASVQAEMRDITTYNSFVGNVQPAAERAVVAGVSEQVVTVYVKEGDHVSEGDVIAQLDTEAAQYNIARQEATLANTQTGNTYTIKDAQRNYDNYKEALDAGLNSSLNSAKNQMDAAEATLKSAKSTYEDTARSIDEGSYEATAQAYRARSDAKNAYDAAISAYEAASTQIAAYQAQIEDLNGQIAALEAQNTAPGSADAANPDATDPDASQAAAPDSAALAELKNQLQTVQSQLETAQAGLPALEATKNSAQGVYEEASRQFDAARQEILNGLQASIDSAQRSYDTAVQSYDAAVLQAEQQLETYAANVEKARATSNTSTSQLELQNLQDGLEDYTITAPCSGTITALNVKTGEMVSNGMTVATISNLNSMEIAIRVDEYSILNVGVGHPVTIYIDSIDQSYPGTIARVASAATIENGVSFYEATVSFTADDAVKAGMSVEVRLTKVDEKNVVAIPSDALHYYDDNTAYVLVPDESGRPTERRVTVGASDGSYVQITEGIGEGESILMAAQNGFAMPEPGPAMDGAE